MSLQDIVNIGGLLIGAAGLAFTVWTRLTARRAATSAEQAAESASRAASNAAGTKTAAVQAQSAAENAHASTVSAQASTMQTGAETVKALVFLAEQLGDSRAVIDRMAARNDDTVAALLHVATILEQQNLPERMLRLEEFAADTETRRAHPPGPVDDPFG